MARAALTVFIAMIATAGSSHAACTTPGEFSSFRSAVRAELTCRLRSLRGGDAPCDHAAVPQCAAGPLDEAVDLVLGSPPVTAPTSPLDRGWSCQRRLVAGARTFLKRRSLELERGGRASRAGLSLRKVVQACGGVIPDELPRSGGACATLVVSGQPIDGARLAACARASLERIVQELLPAPVRPNVVLVLTDDQRLDTLDVMPRLQENLIDRGILFSHGFVTTSLCCPSRASILTGKYAHNHGVQTNAGAFVFDPSDTIPIHLRNAGYKTALLGKYMVATGAALGNSIPPGWDEWRVFKNDLDLYFNYTLNENGTPRTYGSAPGDYSTDVLTGFAEEFLQAERDGPFFLMLALFAPHTVATAAPRHEGAFQGIAPWRPPSWREVDTSDKPVWLRNIRFFVGSAQNAIAATDQRRIDQLETLLAVDETVERLSVALERLGLTDNTLVIFTSDNGYMWMEHWLLLKNYPYEESIRVPFVLRYPTMVPVSREMNEFVLNVDLAPTFAELARVQGPAAMNGRSLVPLLRNDTTGWRDDILIEHFSGASIDPHAGVRTKRWKYIETEASGLNRELYDLDSDPYELENVFSAPANAEVVAQLAARLAVLRAE